MRIKIDPADKYFSLCVRERAGNRCEVEGCTRTSEHYRIDCSHLFSRRHNSTRWDPLNAFAHCFLHHQELGGDPVKFARWADKKLGKETVEALYVKSAMTLKLSKADKAYIAKHYREEYKRMLEDRDSGEVGYLPFAHWGNETSGSRSKGSTKEG